MVLLGGKITRLAFKEILDKGRGFYSPFFNLKVAKLDQFVTKPTFKVVVSSKVAKKAHDRNLLKRRVKSVLHSSSAQISKNVAFIIFTKPGLKGQTFAIIKDDLIKLLTSAGVILNK